MQGIKYAPVRVQDEGAFRGATCFYPLRFLGGGLGSAITGGNRFSYCRTIWQIVPHLRERRGEVDFVIYPTVSHCWSSRRVLRHIETRRLSERFDEYLPSRCLVGTIIRGEIALSMGWRRNSEMVKKFAAGESNFPVEGESRVESLTQIMVYSVQEYRP